MGYIVVRAVRSDIIGSAYHDMTFWIIVGIQGRIR